VPTGTRPEPWPSWKPNPDERLVHSRGTGGLRARESAGLRLRGLTAKEWAQLADSGATTYTTGEPAQWIGVFADRSAAEALADEHGGT
jgi:hypothetical protein